MDNKHKEIHEKLIHMKIKQPYHTGFTLILQLKT